MKKKTYPLVYPNVPWRFARSVVVGDLIFLSGSSGRTLETGEVSSDKVEEQMVVALDKIKGALEEAGSSLENIVKTTIYLRNVEDYDKMRGTEREYYRKHAPRLLDEPPASTFIVPVSLWRASMLVEIDVIACMP